MTTDSGPSSSRGALLTLGSSAVIVLCTALTAVPGMAGEADISLSSHGNQTLAKARFAAPALDTAVLAGGCFWGMELVYEHVKGVVSVVSGFAGGGGSDDSPSYEQVSGGHTEYAESVRIVYDPSRVSYPDILRVFFSAAHDPTQKDGQGPDIGPQYRSAIFYVNQAQARDAREYIRQLTASNYFGRPMVTEVSPLLGFHEAEAYHQDYAVRNPEQPYIVINDQPRLERLKTRLPQLYTSERAP